MGYIEKVLKVNSKPLLDITHLHDRVDRLLKEGVVYNPKCGEHQISNDILNYP